MKLLYTALLIAFPSIIFAQFGYQEGYILKNNGDTVKGYINYRWLVYSPRTITFKLTKTDLQEQEFNPKTIKGFQINIKGFPTRSHVNGVENYIGYTGRISNAENIFPDLPSGLDSSEVMASVFLKQLVVGKHLMLYFNNQTNKNRFFVVEANQPIIELKYYDYYIDSKTKEKIDKLFIGQLLLYVSKYNNDDKKIEEKIKHADFEKTDLEEIIDLINK